MFEFIDQIKHYLPLYLLVFARLSAMVASMPILGYTTVYSKLRILFVVLLTGIVAPMLINQNPVAYTSWLLLAIDVMREVLLGLIVGYGARLIFEGFTIAGAYVGMQIGFAVISVFDPSNQEQQPIVSNFWFLVIITFFLVTNSHYFLIAVLFKNFSIIPVGTAMFHPVVGRDLIHGGTLMFDLALKFGAPLMVFLLTIDVAIAFMARVMPQLNIFFISLPLKIGVGIFLLVLSLNIFQSLFAYVNSELQTFVYGILKGI